MEISMNDYCVWVEGLKIYYEGMMCLLGIEVYVLILELMNSVLNVKLDEIVFDLIGLEFLNSLGINLLVKFMIEICK